MTPDGTSPESDPGTRALLDGLAEGVLEAAPDGTVAYANPAAGDLLGRPVDELVGADLRAVFPRSVEATFHERYGEPGTDDPLADTGADGAEFEEYYPELEAWLAVRAVPAGDGLAVSLQEVTDRKRRERAIEARESALDTLDRINRIVHAVIESLVGATSRTEIETAVCERLVDSDLYAAAWIGEPGGDGLVHRAGGGDEGLLEAAVEGSTTPGAAPERAAVESGELRAVEALAEDEAVPEPVRRAAFAGGLQSGLAVPLAYGDTGYGVLGVYAARPDAFGRHERLGFATLGEVVGFAINAARQRNLLLSDTVLELGLRVSDPGAFLAAASGRLDATLTVEGIVPQDEETLLCYVLVEGADPEALAAAAAGTAGVEARRVVHTVEEDNGGDTGQGGLVELAVSGASPARRLVARGATVRTARYESGSGRVVAEASPDTDAREVVEAVTDAFPGTELVTKREREREVETAQAFRSDLRERLTDRQLQALRTAFLADYFESPRGSSAREVGDALGITAPTLLHHLRAAQRKLLEAFFEEEAQLPE
jgi:hypothetical protein